MTPSTIYRKAAEKIASGDELFACCAINPVGTCANERAFKRMFKPWNITGRAPWFGFHWQEENQLARSLALLFMAEIMEDS